MREKVVMLRFGSMISACVLVAAVIVGIAGCGQSGPPEKGLLVSGPGVDATQPPWAPRYANLAQRIRTLGLPTGESEKFHIHALLNVYNQGLLVTVPANVGIDKRHDIETTIHTHDGTGIVHMEAPRPYRYTLGDFFEIWGVRFGAGTLGGLQDSGSNRVWVYVNGKQISDPARYVIKNGDDISVGYGTKGSFPHAPDTYVLRQVMAGKGTLDCTGGPVKKRKACAAPKRSPKV